MGQGELALRRWFLELWNGGKIELFSQYAAPDVIFHTVAPNSEQLVGIDGFRNMYDSIRAAFSDINFAVEDTIESGNSAAIRWTCTMTHTGDKMGVPATGKKVRISDMAFVYLENGKVVEAWDGWDRHGLMQQVGGQLHLA